MDKDKPSDGTETEIPLKQIKKNLKATAKKNLLVFKAEAATQLGTIISAASPFRASQMIASLAITLDIDIIDNGHAAAHILVDKALDNPTLRDSPILWQQKALLCLQRPATLDKAVAILKGLTQHETGKNDPLCWQDLAIALARSAQLPRNAEFRDTLKAEACKAATLAFQLNRGSGKRLSRSKLLGTILGGNDIPMQDQKTGGPNR